MAKSKSKKSRSKSKSKQSNSIGMKVKKVILAIAIAIIFSLFVGFGISVFYDSPEYDDYCGREAKRFVNNSAECEAAGGRWNAYNAPKPMAEEGYCDQNYYCYEEYDKATEGYDKTVFIITSVIGIITIIVSVMLNLPSVSAGLMAGGVITIIYGILRYWRHSTDFLRFVILGIVLAILIWLGYKKLNK